MPRVCPGGGGMLKLRFDRCATLADCRLADLQTAGLQNCRLADLQTADLQTCRLQTCRLADFCDVDNVTLDNKMVTTSYNLKVLDNEFIVLKSRHGVALPFVCPF